ATDDCADDTRAHGRTCGVVLSVRTIETGREVGAGGCGHEGALPPTRRRGTRPELLQQVSRNARRSAETIVLSGTWRSRVCRPPRPIRAPPYRPGVAGGRCPA